MPRTLRERHTIAIAGTRPGSGRRPYCRLIVRAPCGYLRPLPGPKGTHDAGVHVRSSRIRSCSMAALLTSALLVLLLPAGAQASSPVPQVAPATTGPATLVRDIDTSGSANPRDLRALVGTVVFTARDDEHGREPWVTTADSAVRLRDIAPGPAGSGPRELTVVGARVYFSAAEPAHGRELWMTDGTGAGTQRVRDIRHGSSGAGPRALTAFHGKTFFVADDGLHGPALWKSDGTATGTLIVRSLAAYGPMTVFHDRLYFGTPTGLWATDGLPAGTHRVSPARPGGTIDRQRLGAVLRWS